MKNPLRESCVQWERADDHFISRSRGVATGNVVVEAIYALTSSFPREELFGLTSQLRAYRNYVIRALGSHAECETQLELALRLKLADPERIRPVTTLATRVGQILHGLLRSLPKT